MGVKENCSVHTDPFREIEHSERFPAVHSERILLAK